jgi:large subunit ribosomal protein L9
MELILLQKVANLGNIGDRVKVKSGYGRNFLLPKGKATLATPDNVARFEARRAELERARNESSTARSSAPRRFKEFKLTITAKAGTEGKLFGSVGTADIAEAAPRPATSWRAAKCACRRGRCARRRAHGQLHLHADVDVSCRSRSSPKSRAEAGLRGPAHVPQGQQAWPVRCAAAVRRSSQCRPA